jgi:hypothetical protein
MAFNQPADHLSVPLNLQSLTGETFAAPSQNHNKMTPGAPPRARVTLGAGI